MNRDEILKALEKVSRDRDGAVLPSWQIEMISRYFKDDPPSLLLERSGKTEFLIRMGYACHILGKGFVVLCKDEEEAVLLKKRAWDEYAYVLETEVWSPK